MVEPVTWKIVDAKGMIFGRMCSQVAKLALLGEHVLVINAKDAVISGRRNWILERYLLLTYVHSLSNPRRGPYHQFRPDTFTRQRIRSMLPKRKRGKVALRRVHVYINDVPKAKEISYQKKEPISLKNVASSRLSHKFMSIAEICAQTGWNGNSRKMSTNAK